MTTLLLALFAALGVVLYAAGVVMLEWARRRQGEPWWPYGAFAWTWPVSIPVLWTVVGLAGGRDGEW